MPKQKITENQVKDVLNAFDFLEFSSSYNATAYGNMGYYTPDIVNRKMQDITMQPLQGTANEIEKALSRPQQSETILRKYAIGLEVQNMYYKRLIQFVSDSPSFNLTFTTLGDVKLSEYNSKEYKEDLKILKDFIFSFDYKEEFRKALRQIIRQGAYFVVLRDEEDSKSLQELPIDYCKITGRFSKGLVFDFNFEWFINAYGVDINMYPPIFKKMLKEIYENMSNEYDPAKSLNRRNSSYVYWHQCKPKNGFWCFKSNPEITTLIPYYAPLFPDLTLQPIVRKLQMDKNFIEASKLLVGILGMNKNNKSGTVQNQTNITPEILGKFLGTARAGLSKQIGLTALPVDSIETVDFKTQDKDILMGYLKSMSSNSSSISSAFIDDNKLIQHQSKIALDIESNFIKSFYALFENFMEYYINSKTNKYKFKIKFNDINTSDDFDKRSKLFESLSSKGIVDWQLVARVSDKNIFELENDLIYSKSLGMNKYLTTLETIYTQSSKKDKPVVENTDNDSTAANQDIE